jgi:hypothetical protein
LQHTALPCVTRQIGIKKSGKMPMIRKGGACVTSRLFRDAPVKV